MGRRNIGFLNISLERSQIFPEKFLKLSVQGGKNLFTENAAKRVRAMCAYSNACLLTATAYCVRLPLKARALDCHFAPFRSRDPSSHVTLIRLQVSLLACLVANLLLTSVWQVTMLPPGVLISASLLLCLLAAVQPAPSRPNANLEELINQNSE